MSLVVGTSIDRKDGPLKVTGQARYAADHPLERLAHAVAVHSTIAHGRIQAIDSAQAERAPGFLAILHHGNVPRLQRPTNNFMSASKAGEIRVVFEDDRVHYVGQYVALVVAETLEQARFAAGQVTIAYAAEPPLVDTDAAMHTAYPPDSFFGEKLNSERGRVDDALAAAAVRFEASYTTPTEHHNPLEPSASIAAWNGDELTLYETTQWVAGAKTTVAETLRIDEKTIHIVSPFIGGGFGCKGFVWPHSVLSALAARAVGRPVKLNLSRKEMFSACGHRSETRQVLRIGTDRDGRLTAIDHDTIVQTSPVDEFVEACGTTTRIMYSCPNVRVRHRAVRVNIATPTPMRAPGENPGLFALESALDELSYQLNIDPVALRIINHADKNEHHHLPWSSKYLKDCYQIAGDRFGWRDRPSQPGSMRDGPLLVGWGMASATYPGIRSEGAAKVRILKDGSVDVISATQDMGGGTYTTMAQIVADVLGVPVNRIHVRLGDSELPKAPVSGGSMTTASVLPATRRAARQALERLVDAAGGAAAGKGTSFADLVARAGRDQIEGDGSTGPGAERRKYAFQSFGAHFVEVKVDADIAKATVSRVVSAFDVGKIVNPKTARSQGFSGIVMGIGMALMEHTVYDPRDGSIVTSNLADYAVPVNGDVHEIEVLFIDKPDPHIDTEGLGARGVGEITVTGVAAAIANAIYHATGKRLRDLPITPDKLL